MCIYWGHMCMYVPDMKFSVIKPVAREDCLQTMTLDNVNRQWMTIMLTDNGQLMIT